MLVSVSLFSVLGQLLLILFPTLVYRNSINIDSHSLRKDLMKNIVLTGFKPVYERIPSLVYFYPFLSNILVSLEVNYWVINRHGIALSRKEVARMHLMILTASMAVGGGRATCCVSFHRYHKLLLVWWLCQRYDLDLFGHHKQIDNRALVSVAVSPSETPPMVICPSSPPKMTKGMS